MTTIKSYNSLSNFNLPRTISLGLKLKIFFNGPLAVMGLCLFLFGSIFPIVFGSMADFKSVFTFNENDPATRGLLNDIRETANSENKRKVFEYNYQYLVDNKTYTGTSFSAFSTLKFGDSANVQYIAKQPELSRIQGMRAAPFSFSVVPFTSIFPLVGFVFLIISLSSGKKNIYLVQNGILTDGRVTRKEPTNAKINNQIVYKIFFQYISQDGNLQESFVKSHKLQKLGDELNEPLVYDSQNPSQAVLLDSLPKKIRTLITNV